MNYNCVCKLIWAVLNNKTKSFTLWLGLCSYPLTGPFFYVAPIISCLTFIKGLSGWTQKWKISQPTLIYEPPVHKARQHTKLSWLKSSAFFDNSFHLSYLVNFVQISTCFSLHRLCSFLSLILHPPFLYQVSHFCASGEQERKDKKWSEGRHPIKNNLFWADADLEFTLILISHYHLAVNWWEHEQDTKRPHSHVRICSIPTDC